jgi:toxin ParE1/3/4
MPEKFHLDIELEALDDIQEAIDYYNSKQDALGKRFFETVDTHFEFLKKDYMAFAIRYDDIRCMPVEKFPYHIHYRVLESQKVVSVKAVFCTYDNPDKWEKRSQ